MVLGASLFQKAKQQQKSAPDQGKQSDRSSAGSSSSQQAGSDPRVTSLTSTGTSCQPGHEMSSEMTLTRIAVRPLQKPLLWAFALSCTIHGIDLWSIPLKRWLTCVCHVLTESVVHAGGKVAWSEARLAAESSSRSRDQGVCLLTALLRVHPFISRAHASVAAFLLFNNLHMLTFPVAPLSATTFKACRSVSVQL